MSKFILSAFADEIHSDLDVQMEVLKKHNIEYIEMRGVNGRNVTDYSVEEMKEIKKQLDSNGMKISAIGSPIGKIDITDDFSEHLVLFKHTVELAKILETKYIRMFSFFIPEDDSADHHRSEVFNRLKAFLDVVKGTEIVLLHENEKEIYGDTAERCLDIIKTFGCDNFKLIFDPANFIQCKVETYPYAFELLKEYITYMHIKDATMVDGKVVPSGYGDGHIKEILSELDKSNYEGFLSLEPHLGNFDGFAALENDHVDAAMEKSDEGLFAIACNALKKILESII